MKRQKRPALLLEVLIAAALIALAAIPIIASQAELVAKERQFIQEISLDAKVNLIYIALMQRMYEGKIGIADIEGGNTFPIDATLLEESGVKGNFPLESTYVFKVLKKKSNEEKSAYIISTQIKAGGHIFSHDLAVAHAT